MSYKCEFKVKSPEYAAERKALDLNTIEAIHAAQGRFVLIVTGGGASAITRLLAVAGASNTLIEANVPYDGAALTACLNSRPENACSDVTARVMAMAAYQKARLLAPGETVYGLGCTAALATNRTRRGTDRCHVAIQSAHDTVEYTIILNKADSREIQEHVCGNLIVGAIANILRITTAGTLTPDAVKRAEHATVAWQKLLQDDLTHDGPDDIRVLFPGAFNPFHDGHRKMMTTATRMLGQPVYLEISVRNVDKPQLDYIEMAKRKDALGDLPLIFSNAPTFQQKSTLFPGATFVVGLDTITRIADRKYYAGSLVLRDKAIMELVSRQHQFLVFGRVENDQFLTLEDVSLPADLLRICQGVAENEFRSDESSTQLRSEHRDNETNPL